MLTSVSQANDSWLLFAGISLLGLSRSASCRVQNLHVVASHASAPKISNTFCGCAPVKFSSIFLFFCFSICWLFFERTFMVYYTNGNAPRAQPGRSSTSAIISKLIEMCDIMLAAIERKWPTSDARLPHNASTSHPQFCGSAFNVDFILHPRRRYAAIDRRLRVGLGLAIALVLAVAGSLPMPRSGGVRPGPVHDAHPACPAGNQLRSRSGAGAALLLLPWPYALNKSLALYLCHKTVARTADEYLPREMNNN